MFTFSVEKELPSIPAIAERSAKTASEEFAKLFGSPSTNNKTIVIYIQLTGSSTGPLLTKTDVLAVGTASVAGVVDDWLKDNVVLAEE
jgi:hypothetical protein